MHKGVGSHWNGVVGGCELIDVGAQLESFASDVCILLMVGQSFQPCMF